MFRSLIELIVVVVAAVATIAEESQSDSTAAEIYGRHQSLCVCQSHVVLLLQMSMSCSKQITRGKPIILLIGHIVIAHKEWSSLGTIAQLRQIDGGTREQFLQELESGVHDGVVAISRTFDSTEITGRFDVELISRLPSSLKTISHNGAGYDSIDAAACARRGISVSNTPGAVDASTASTAMYLMLGALRRSHIPSTALRAGNWRGHMKLTHDPENKTLGILGMGGIGTAFAKRAVPFGMKLQYHNRRMIPPERNTVGAKYVEFEELLRTSDVVSVHLPLTNSTRRMIGQREFSMMKDGVVLINTARGPIIDENALVEALECGKVYGAGLDVYEREPEIHEGLIRNENCVLMPHVGTGTLETQRKMEILVIENLRMAITTGKLATPVAESREMIYDTNGIKAVPLSSPEVEAQADRIMEADIDRLGNHIEEIQGLEPTGMQKQSPESKMCSEKDLERIDIFMQDAPVGGLAE